MALTAWTWTDCAKPAMDEQKSAKTTIAHTETELRQIIASPFMVSAMVVRMGRELKKHRRLSGGPFRLPTRSAKSGTSLHGASGSRCDQVSAALIHEAKDCATLN